MQRAAEEALAKVQAEQDKEALRKIARAFTQEEWQTILQEAPPSVLAGELVDRATDGERILKRMREAWEEENKRWS